MHKANPLGLPQPSAGTQSGPERALADLLSGVFADARRELRVGRRREGLFLELGT